MDAPSNTDEGNAIDALKTPLLSSANVSEDVPRVTGEPPIDELYILNVKVFEPVSGVPCALVSLPSYPIICGIAEKAPGDITTIKRNAQTRIRLNIKIAPL